MVPTDNPELEFEFSLKPDEDAEFSHCLLHFVGKAIQWNDDAAEDIVVGTITGHRLDLAIARAMKIDFQYFLESVSSQLSDLGQKVFDGEGTCMLEASEIDGTSQKECDCLVYIEEIIVHPEHRGEHIGTYLFQRMSGSIDMENGLVALKAYPITGDLESAGTTRKEEEIAKVKHFYERLGFEHSIDDFMVKDARHCAAQKKRREAKADQ
jgi:GNAT superfamily N-acetyltransferase